MIASYNISDMRFDRSDPRMDGFFDSVDRINALADRSPGFLWRLDSPPSDADAKAQQVKGTTLSTLSVWDSVEALGNFVFNTVHVQLYLRRREWFDAITRAHFVMWHHDEADWPSEDHAKHRLAHFNTHGSSDFAFGWDRVDTSQWTRMGQTQEMAHV